MKKFLAGIYLSSFAHSLHLQVDVKYQGRCKKVEGGYDCVDSANKPDGYYRQNGVKN